MKRLLIVEDEKMIRQGIKAMVSRAPVDIEEILESRNGEEALKILESQRIDVMLTDVRMPKMDGITLIKKMQELSYKPKTIVISGFDDFNYAVEVLRHGVREYILKPVEREKLVAILEKLDKEIAEELNQADLTKQINSQQLKYIILNERIEEIEIEIIEKQFRKGFLYKSFLICCSFQKQNWDMQREGIINLGEVDGNTIFIVANEEVEEIINNYWQDNSVGISKSYDTIKSLRKAYLEALHARKTAFVEGKSYCYYEEEDKEYETIPSQFCEQFAQLFGTDKIEGGLAQLETILSRAKKGKIEVNHILDFIDLILNRLQDTYQNVIEMDMDGFMILKQPIVYKDMQTYYTDFELWIRVMKERMLSEFEDYKNKEKINLAIQYIHENYAKDLNMAVVSNYISMNYSLFSLNFKQYTGTNFVNYLKKIRIDEAKSMLEETEEKIVDISRKVGYDNEKHFMKIFKNISGVSPSEYRKNSQIGKKM